MVSRSDAAQGGISTTVDEDAFVGLRRVLHGGHPRTLMANEVPGMS
jgi:hypothetical protein